MRRTGYREQDYIFGQRMLTLRTSIGLTQGGLAEILGVSRNAVGNWEAGLSYPKAEHLKALIVLGLQNRVFAAEQEEEQIRTLWHAAHQKVLLDERWLRELLHQQDPSLIPAPSRQIPAQEMSVPPDAHGPRVDWSGALDVPVFYGREAELALLSRWIVQERCRVVSVLGMGGIGKSALVVKVMHQLAAQFQVVIWRSLRDSPSCELLIESCLQVLAPQTLSEMPISLERRLYLLMEQLRTQRVLLVLDNLETLLEEGTGTGRLREGFDDYSRLLQQIGETLHQSCLLLTTREMLAALVPLEGRRSPVRRLRLTGLDAEAGTELLGSKDVTSPLREQMQLVEVYQGNPLALKIVAQTIVELFGGEIAPFLQQGEVVFGGVRDLLDEQFTRLSSLEQAVLLWLAILREPVSLQDLLAVLSIPRPGGQVLEAVEGLRRRSMVEQGQRVGNFMLQSVVLEYASSRLIAEASREIEQGQLARLLEHGLSLASVRDYVRRAQEHLLVLPLLSQLQGASWGHAAVEARLLRLLDGLRGQDRAVQGYGPANLVTMLRVLRGHLRGLDLSWLALRNVFLQGIDMQDTTLSNATMQDSVFTEPFDAFLTVAISGTGQYWAAADSRGEIRIWEEGGRVLRRVWRAHAEMVWTLSFSTDERRLASAGANDIKLWDVNTGTLLWESWRARSVLWLAFSPDEDVLASAEFFGLVRLWDYQHNAPPRELVHSSRVFSLAWSPDGRFLASGCVDGSIWLWEPGAPEPNTQVQVFAAHTDQVRGLVFSSDGTQLASASYDGTVKLWDLTTATCLQTFVGHTDRVRQVLWSPDGRMLVSSGYDATIRFWDLQSGRASKVLQGHTSLVTNMAFAPDGNILLSSSHDGTLRVWEVESGQCLRIMGGYIASLLDLDWSPDGTLLASCGTDTLLMLWNTANGTVQSVVQGHPHIVPGQGVAWSPDGRLLASGGREFIGLWDSVTGALLHELRDRDAADTFFQGVAWSPDGRLLACGSYGRGVQVWEIATGQRRWVRDTQAARVRRVAWSPDGRLLASGDYNGSMSLWDANAGDLQRQLIGHDGVIMSIAWSPDGRLLASGGGGREGGQLFIWNAYNGEQVHAVSWLSLMVSAVAWSSGGEQLVSGDSDGRLRWWEIGSGQCVRVREGHQGGVHALKLSPDGTTLASCGDDGAIRLWNLYSGELLQTLRRDRPYERLNITGIRGLSPAQKASLHDLGAFEETSAEE